MKIILTILLFSAFELALIGWVFAYPITLLMLIKLSVVNIIGGLLYAKDTGR